MNPSQKDYRLNRLLVLAFEGSISESQLAELEAMLRENPRLRSDYWDFVIAYTSLCNLDVGNVFPKTCLGGRQEAAAKCGINFDENLWGALAEMERAAPAEFPEEEQSNCLIQEVVYPPKEKRKLTKLQAVTLVMSAAAVLFFALFLHIVPDEAYTSDVATVVDQIGVTWADSQVDFDNGDRLWTNQEPIGLDRGVIEIQYDEGVDVVIEGPAKFVIDRSGIYLEYGRLFSHVSQSGLGFLVETPNTRFVDLGTEFGVQADVNGSSELHVIKGKVQLFAGSQGDAKSSRVIKENQAARYDAHTGRTQAIPVKKEAFARSVNSASNLVWRGQKSIDLADVVGGGNGSGNGMQNRAIRWDGKELVAAWDLPSNIGIPEEYVPVSFSPFIDGIFVPNSKGEPVNLSSDPVELNFDEFLQQDTNGVVTLIVLREDNDTASSYWFYSKEGAGGDREKMPSLYFPKGSNGQPVEITTADDRGADTAIVYDVRNKSNRRYGDRVLLHCKYIKDSRMRMLYLRFDVSQLDDLSGAVLNLCLESGNRRRDLSVYGLKDGSWDFWDEATLDYDTAPGLQTAALGNYEFDPGLCAPLGTFRVIDNRAYNLVVSSNGSFKWNVPEPVEKTDSPIANAGTFRDPDVLEELIQLQLGGEPCGTPDNPAVLVHANSGITFDLEAMRKVYGPLKSFTSLCGVSPTAAIDEDTDNGSASFYVLLDGQEVFSSVDVLPENDAVPIEVELPNEKRFLTLITTQGSDGSHNNDLCLFVKPRINTE